jgi:hypothetical protein
MFLAFLYSWQPGERSPTANAVLDESRLQQPATFHALKKFLVVVPLQLLIEVEMVMAWRGRLYKSSPVVYVQDWHVLVVYAKYLTGHQCGLSFSANLAVA